MLAYGVSDASGQNNGAPLGFIPHVVIPEDDDTGFSASLAAAQPAVFGVATGIPLTVRPIDAPFNPALYSHSNGDSAVTVLMDGRYRISYAGCGQNAPGPRASVAWFLALDRGSGFLPAGGTLGETFHFGGVIGVGQAFNFLETDLSAGNRVQLEAILLMGGPNVTPTILACKLGIVRVAA